MSAPPSTLSLAGKTLYISGHKGMVGSALVRRLRAAGCNNLLTRSHSELELTDRPAVRTFFAANKIDWVVVAAARVGGIHANNTYPADFLEENLDISSNLIVEARRAGVEQLLFLGSSCIYPRLASSPIHESALLSGPLEPTNEPYAIAKIAAIKLCESSNRQHGTDYRSLMPANLYGPGDNFHLANSHVLPALMRKFHEANKSNAPSVEVWGDGKARREFLHVDDLADSCVHFMNLPPEDYHARLDPRCSHLNIGIGHDISIGECAELMQRITGFAGKIVFDPTKPAGAPRRHLDCSLASELGWQAKISLEDGLASTYEWFCQQHQDGLRLGS